jgi:hypothetical protein
LIELRPEARCEMTLYGRADRAHDGARSQGNDFAKRKIGVSEDVGLRSRSIFPATNIPFTVVVSMERSDGFPERQEDLSMQEPWPNARTPSPILHGYFDDMIGGRQLIWVF